MNLLKRILFIYLLNDNKNIKLLNDLNLNDLNFNDNLLNQQERELLLLIAIYSDSESIVNEIILSDCKKQIKDFVLQLMNEVTILEFLQIHNVKFEFFVIYLMNKLLLGIERQNNYLGLDCNGNLINSKGEIL